MAGPAKLQLSVLEIASTLAETRRLHAWLDDQLIGLSVPDKRAHAVRLCIEEAVMNVILHAYGTATPGAIEIALGPEPPGILVRIVDTAPPFDPTQQTGRPAAANLHSDPLGGNGLILMRRYSDFLHYEYLQGQNRLTMGFAV